MSLLLLLLRSLVATTVFSAFAYADPVLFEFSGTGIHKTLSMGGQETTAPPYEIHFIVTLPNLPTSLANGYDLQCGPSNGCPSGTGATILRGPGTTSDVLFFAFLAPYAYGFYGFQFPTGTFSAVSGPVASILDNQGVVTITATTPEPQTFLMAALGLMMVYAVKRQRSFRSVKER
jgi:hypothetical protein